MKKIFKAVKSYFTFTKGETIAFLLLIFSVIALQILKPFFDQKDSSNLFDIESIKKLSDSIDSAEKRIDKHPYSKSDNSKHFIQYKEFYFNPNTVSIDQLSQLGCPQYLSKRIINYRLKVAPFKEKTDLLKIYGMDSNWYNRIQSYVELPVQSSLNSDQKEDKNSKFKKKLIININTADSIELKSLPGIGEKLSKRIVQYRNLLGGFYRIEQLKEIYGLNEDTYEIIKDLVKINPSDVVSITINTADYSNLSKHPYIGYNQAKMIVNYIKQHGQINSFDELLKIKEIDIEKMNKAMPYLQF